MNIMEKTMKGLIGTVVLVLAVSSVMAQPEALFQNFDPTRKGKNTFKPGTFRVVPKMESDLENLSDKELQAFKLTKSREFYQRMEGIKALESFKSDRNIKRLKELLKDPWFYIYGNKEVKKRFPVRHKAYNLLQSWGISIEGAVVVEEQLSVKSN